VRSRKGFRKMEGNEEMLKRCLNEREVKGYRRDRIN
jgi:hypothetical protein